MTVVPERVPCSLGDEHLGDGHHVGVVAEGLVQLQHRELGVVPAGQALVAEHPPDLEHPLHPADDQPLQVQLQRDAQVQLEVQGVVVGDEGAGVGAAGLEVEDRRLDLHEAVVGQGGAERGHHGMADLEDPPGLLVDDEIGVALAVAGVDVGQALPLVGQWAQRLGQQLEAVHLDGELSLPGHHDRALDAHPVAQIEGVEAVVGVLAQHSPGDEELQLSGPIAKGGEGQLSLPADEHEAAGHGDPLVGLGPGRELGVAVADLTQRVGAIEAVRVGVGAVLPERLELGQAQRRLWVRGRVHGRLTLVPPPGSTGAKCDDTVTALACPPATPGGARRRDDGGAGRGLCPYRVRRHRRGWWARPARSPSGSPSPSSGTWSPTSSRPPSPPPRTSVPAPPCSTVAPSACTAGIATESRKRWRPPAASGRCPRPRSNPPRRSSCTARRSATTSPPGTP